MQMMFKMFKFMQMMHQSQESYHNHNNNYYNQPRPYSNNDEMEENNMPMPMKMMMKMMMKKMMHKNMDMDMYDNQHNDQMQMRSDPMESRMEKLEALLKNVYQKNKNSNYDHHDMNMKMFRSNKHGGMFNKFDMMDSDMGFGGLLYRRQARAVQSNLDLGDRLVEKLQSQKEEMQGRVGNLTCILQELNILDNNNKLSIFSMKKDLAQYNLPSQWFKENYEQLLDTCHEMATTLPAYIEDEYIVEGDFGTINMTQIKLFMSCIYKGKSKLCMNYDIKKKIEENFGPLDDILAVWSY